MSRSNWLNWRKTLVVLGLLIFLHFIGALQPIESQLQKWFGSVLSGLYHTGDSPSQNCSADLEKTRQQLADQTKLQADNLELSQENQKLREYMNFFSSRKNQNYLLAKVSLQENFLDAAKYGQDLIIDKGSKDGLTTDLVVLDSQGLVAGKVVEVKDNMSRVCLLTNNACKLAVTVLNNDRTIGVSTGDLGLTVKLNFVGQTEKVSVGDIIVTSGLEENIPSGLVLGKVSQISDQENDVWQNISVEPLINFNSLKMVSVILP